jgi:hypothetical protein
MSADSNTDSTVRRATGPGQTVAIGASSAATTAMPSKTRAVRLVATVNCWVEIGATAAATTSTFLPANSPEYFEVLPGELVAVVQASGAGSLYVRPVN